MTVVLAAIEFAKTITLGSILVAALVIVLGGVPFRLLANLKSERDLERERANKAEKLLALRDAELAELRAKTDLSGILKQQHELHLAGIDAVSRIAAEGVAQLSRETAARIDQLEASVSGAFASFARDQKTIAELLGRTSDQLGRVADSLDLNGDSPRQTGSPA